MHSSRAVLKEKRRAGKASGSQMEKLEEPVKRKNKSKHGSKKAAKKVAPTNFTQVAKLDMSRYAQNNCH